MRSLILGTAGHIDHGKTALVRALTGVDTDRLEEEKRRGISIDLGFAQLDLDGCRLGIVDVPGHERFIRNMLAGVTGVDVALLVVAADDSVMPQTREHLAILEFLGVQHGLVVLTKTDLVEPDWLDLVEEDVRGLVKGGFLEGAAIVRSSATTGAGIDDLRDALAALCGRVEARRHGELFRLPVDRAFVVQGLGTIVTGSVWSGSAKTGDELEWLPSGRPVRVRGLQSHGRDVDEIDRGRRAALNLSGAHHTEIRRGHEIAAPGLLRPSRRLTVRLRALPDAPRPVRHRSRVRLHIGTQEVVAAVVLLEAPEIAPGAAQLARLNCAEPVVARCRQPFVVRSESPMRTIGGGAVLQPIARRASRRRPAALERIRGLDDDDEAVRAASAIHLYGATPWTDLDLCRDADLEPSGVGALLRRLDDAGETIVLGAAGRRPHRLHRESLDEISVTVRKAVARLHESSPLEPSIPRGRLATALPHFSPDLVQGALDRMLAGGDLEGDDTAVCLPEFAPRLTDSQRRWHGHVLETLHGAGYRPPDPAEVGRAVGATPEQMRSIFDLCAAQGEIVRLAGGLYLHAHWARELERTIVEHLRAGPGLAVTEIKDLLGTSRKYAVPMCEYLDRVGITRRAGDLRVLGEGTKGLRD